MKSTFETNFKTIIFKTNIIKYLEIEINVFIEITIFNKYIIFDNIIIKRFDIF